MKYCILGLGIIITLFAVSCQKYPDVTTPDFNVTTDSTTYEVNQPITFNFTGDADAIVFWAGDPSRNYEFRNRVIVQGGKPQFSFSSLRKFGNNPGVPDSTLQLMVSTDFSGNYAFKDVQKATWINISSRAAFSDGASSSIYTPSGPVDLSDIPHKDSLGHDSAIYIAFWYHEAQQIATKRAWYTKDYSVENILPDSTIVNVASNTMLWSAVEIQDSLRQWFIYSNNALMWGGNSNYPETEDYLISQPLFLDRVNPDLGVSVKTNPATVQTSYLFNGYPKEGTYTAVFLATNANRWQSKTVLRKIIITIVK